MPPQRSNAATPSNGSRTVTEDTPVALIRLTGGPRSRPQVTWDEGVVDNENCGKKKSKICCIYHRPRPYDESSSEEDSDSDDGDHRCDKKKDAGNAYEAQPKK